MNSELKKINERIEERLGQNDRKMEQMDEKVTEILAILRNATIQPASLNSERLLSYQDDQEDSNFQQ